MSMSSAEMGSQFFAGASAGVAVLLATHWLDTLKLLGQLGPIDWPAIRRAPLHLYMGITPAVIETAAYNGINFGVYELVKLYWQRRTGAAVGALVPDVTNLFMGLFSGVITQCCTSPLKVVAVRLGSGNTGEKSMSEACRNLWKEGGAFAFFRGNLAGLSSQPLTIALSFYFFERFRFYAERAFGVSSAVTLIAGGLAQDATIMVVYPVRSAKDKLQGQKDGQYSGVMDVWRASYQKSGIRGACPSAAPSKQHNK